MVFGLDPQVIVLNATLNSAWPILLEEISSQFPDKSQWPTFGKLSLRQSALGSQGSLVGAATLGFGPLFNSID